MLRPQDLVILLRLLTGERPASQWGQNELARAIGVSQAEVHNALKRAAESGLYEPHGKKVMRKALLELLVHGVKYIFPARLGSPSRGIATAWAAPPLSEKISAGASGQQPVWAHPDGNVRGSAVEPLYKTVPNVALHDAEMHELLALVDAIRLGRARERRLAEKLLEKRLGA